MKRYADNHKFYAEITKVDADERIVSGYASTEALDSQNEIVTRAALEGALPGWLKFGNIREMHQPSAVGVALKAHFDDRGLLLEAHVVDDAAWKKVTAGVYKGFSIGGRVKGRDKANKAMITEMDLTEISLVDRPANPEALIDVWKADGVQPGEQAASETGEEVGKSMFGVGNLAGILTQIQNAAMDAEWEKQWEGDASTMPDALKEWLKTGGQLLVQMAAEETAELTDDGDAAVEVIALADAAADLAKGGKRNSKADQKKLNDAHDAVVAAGAECGGAAKHEAASDLTKAADELAAIKGDLSKSQDDLAKAGTDLTETQGKLAKAESDLAESQAALDAITKARDEATGSLLAVSKSLETTTTERESLAKRNDTLAADLAAMTSTADALKAEVEKLKAAPEPMKGKLLAVAKGEEVASITKAEDTAQVAAVVAAQETPKYFSARPW